MLADDDVALTCILADKFLMENFKNAVVDRATVAFQAYAVGAGRLIELYKNGLSEHLLAKFR